MVSLGVTCTRPETDHAVWGRCVCTLFLASHAYALVTKYGNQNAMANPGGSESISYDLVTCQRSTPTLHSTIELQMHEGRPHAPVHVAACGGMLCFTSFLVPLLFTIDMHPM